MFVYEIVLEHSQLTCCDIPQRAGYVLPVREELGATKGKKRKKKKKINSLALWLSASSEVSYGGVLSGLLTQT